MRGKKIMGGVPAEGWVLLSLVGVILGVSKWLSSRSRETYEGEPEPYAAAEPQTMCDPTPKPGTKAFRDWTISRYGGYDSGIARACDTGAASEHKEGRAWDWGILAYKGKPAVPFATIDGFLVDLLANDAELARRAGIMILIFNRRIWSSYRHAEGWRPYTGASAHTDHVHFSFSREGGNGKTSFYRGKVLA